MLIVHAIDNSPTPALNNVQFLHLGTRKDHARGLFVEGCKKDTRVTGN
jgi:hypothetical protein